MPAITALNPFGSGTFFIQYITSRPALLSALNPFGSGTFFIPWALFFLFCLNGLKWFFPGFGVVGKLLHFYHVGWFWATCRLWVWLFPARMFWGEAVADWRARGFVVFMGIFMWRVFRLGVLSFVSLCGRVFLLLEIGFWLFYGGFFMNAIFMWFVFCALLSVLCPVIGIVCLCGVCRVRQAAEVPGEAGGAGGRGVGGAGEGRGVGVEVERAFAAGDAGIEEFAAEEAFAVRVQRQGDARIFGAL